MKRVGLKKQKRSVDKSFLALVIGLTLIGLIAVADASAPQALNIFNDKFYFLKQQAIWAGIGILALLVVSQISYRFWQKIATPLFVVSLILLLAVLFPSVGFKALGARRWISLGFFSFQPGELVKLSLVLFLAKVADKQKQPLSYFIPLVVVSLMIMFQPDLGTTLVVLGIGIAQIFVAGVNISSLLAACALGGVAVAGLIWLSPYRRDRLMTFLQVTTDPLGKSYHIRQILLALGSGGLFGVGIGASRQKYLFLPEAATDSIFAVIAEELGFAGGVALIVLFAYLVFKGFSIASRAPDKFAQVVVTGITSWIGGQALLNIASMVALTPLTGIPLPFFSYGGSSLVMILVACGILLNVSKQATYVQRHKPKRK